MTLEEIQERLTQLPQGYISTKHINGREYYYYQWREEGKLRSRYIKAGELLQLQAEIEERKRLQLQMEQQRSHRHLEHYRRLLLQQKVPIGVQDYDVLMENHCFYVDKTLFLEAWWNSMDTVTLITRPRRFGKTLTMSMTECFFSVKYAGRSDLFQGTYIWKRTTFRKYQGTYPIIHISFAGIKSQTMPDILTSLCNILLEYSAEYQPLLQADTFSDSDRIEYEQRRNLLLTHQDRESIAGYLRYLSGILYRYYGKKVIILLDEYDTPVHEAYRSPDFEELLPFLRKFFNLTFKSNPSLERAILTGITRISQESFFSDLNHLRVCTMQSDCYAECFGFTEEEVFAAMEEQNLGTDTNKKLVKEAYDGFIIGHHRDIYNPWSIIHYLSTHKIQPYWIHTSSNQLVGQLILQESILVKESLQALVRGEAIQVHLTDELIFEELSSNEDAVWSLLYAAGYLKILETIPNDDSCFEANNGCLVALTNQEVVLMLKKQIRQWIKPVEPAFNEFTRALLRQDIETMTIFMNRIARGIFSTFDVGNAPSSYSQPERFYHGFVLGLLIDLEKRYQIRSNRESGLGRYDVMMIPNHSCDPAFVLEFKVRNPQKEKSLEETAANALQQIHTQDYDRELLQQGILPEQIHHYGIAFHGKEVYIAGE